MSPKIAHYALLAGLTAFVPLPFLDSYLQRMATRAMYKAIGESVGVPLDEPTLDTLAADRSSLVLGCLGTLFVWPVKKLFRTFFYFLTIKDVLDGIAEASLRAAMLHESLPRLPHGATDVRDVMDATLGRWQYSPVSRFLFRGERPPTEWLLRDELGAIVSWHYRHAGGAPILADFKGRLENR